MVPNYGSLVWWLGAIGGGLLAAVIGHFYNTIVEVTKFGWRRIFEPKSAIEHTWFGYHWTVHRREPTLVKSKWIIKKGVTTLFSVRLEHLNVNQATYTGTARRENGQIFMTLTSDQGKPETTIYRYPDSVGRSVKNIHGLWLSYDYDEYIACSACILSAVELSDAEAEGAIMYGVDCFGDKPLMEVKR